MNTTNQVTQASPRPESGNTTAGDVEYRLSDLAIPLENARTVLHTLSPADAITAVDSILQGASVSLDHVIPSRRKAGSAPKLAAVDAALPSDGLREAEQVTEGMAIALNRIDAAIGAMATSDADEDQLRECLFSAVELIRPVRAEAQRGFDLIAAHRRPAA